MSGNVCLRVGHIPLVQDLHLRRTHPVIGQLQPSPQRVSQDCRSDQIRLCDRFPFSKGAIGSPSRSLTARSCWSWSLSTNLNSLALAEMYSISGWSILKCGTCRYPITERITLAASLDLVLLCSLRIYGCDVIFLLVF